MKLTKVDMKSFGRAELFDHYIHKLRCVISITADVDVTDLLDACKENGYKFYPAFIAVVSNIVNRHDEFKMNYTGGELGLWDYVSPSYIVFHSDDQLFTRLVSQYSPDFQALYGTIAGDIEKHEDKRAFDLVDLPQNTFDISCLPWLRYKSLDFHVFDEGTYMAPVITWGKYESENGKLLMPLSLQIHHAVADGFHVARFYNELKSEMQEIAGVMRGSVKK